MILTYVIEIMLTQQQALKCSQKNNYNMLLYSVKQKNKS